MKILLLTDSMDIGGAETHVASLCRYLVRRGHKVFLLSGGGRLCRELQKDGVVCLTSHFGDRTPFGIAKSIINILRATRLASPHVIHAHGRFVAFLSERIASFLGIPLIVTSHADPTIKRLPKPFTSTADLCIAVSPDIKMKLCKLCGAYGDNIRVIPNGIDTEHFPYTYRADRGIKKIVFISRLDSDCSMGAYELIKISFLLKRLGVSEIVICGGGEEYETLRRLERRTRQRHGETGVRFTSSLDDVRGELCDASLFVGVSRAAMEAMSMGVPAILAGNEGMIGLCTEERIPSAEATNFCCRGEPPMTCQRLYDEIKRYSLMSEEERLSLSLMSRKYIKDKRSSAEMGRETEKLYLDLALQKEKRLEGKEKSCLICGYYGYGNMGDDALLRGAIKRGESEGYGEISALTRRGFTDRKKYGIRCINRYSPLGILMGILHSESLIFGGGTLLQNRTSWRSLLYYLSLVKIADIFGKPWEMWGGGIGELLGDSAERRVSLALKSCRHIGVREKTSYRKARGLLRGSDRIYLEDDLSAKIDRCDDSYGEYLMRHYRIPRKFIIAVPKGRESAELYLKMTEKINTAKRKGLGVAVCCLYPRQDRIICKRIAKLCGGIYVDEITPEEFLYLASRSECVVGMRLHSLIFASRLEKKCIPIGDSIKIKAFEASDHKMNDQILKGVK